MALNRSHNANRWRPVFWFAVAGTVCIFGGELFCLLGPLRYERLVHAVCHAVLYAGVVLIVIAGGLRAREIRRRR